MNRQVKGGKVHKSKMTKAHIIESCLDCPLRRAGPYMPDCCGHDPYVHTPPHKSGGFDPENPDDPETKDTWRVIDTKVDLKTGDWPIPEWCPRPELKISICPDDKEETG